MSIPFLNNLAASTRLARVQAESGEPVFGDKPHVKIRLEGSRDALRAASESIRKYGNKHKLRIDTNMVSSGSSANMDYHLNIHVHTEPSNPGVLVEALEHVRKATHCQLDAHVKSCLVPFTDDGVMNYIPSATITVTHPDRQTTHIIRGYLAKTLDDEYKGQYNFGRIGSLGIPEELANRETCEMPPDGPQDILDLTYRDAVSENKQIAKLRAGAISERLSNLLGIAEISPDKKRISAALG